MRHLMFFRPPAFAAPRWTRSPRNPKCPSPIFSITSAARRTSMWRLLEHTLSDWLEPLRELNPAGDPLTELARYISAKMQMSEANPKASRLFANEILHGAPMIEKFLKGPVAATGCRKSPGHPVLDRGGKACPRRSLSSDLRHLGRHPALRRFFRAGRCGAGPPRGFKSRAKSRAGNSPARAVKVKQS